MGNDNQFHFRIGLKGLFQSDGIHIPGVVLRIDKNGDSSLIDHGIYSGIKGHVRAEYPMSE